MQLLKYFIQLLYPNTCLLCSSDLSKSEDSVCLSCLIELPYTQQAYTKSNPIKELLLGAEEIYKACAYLYFTKEGKTQQLLHELKYNNNIAVGKMLGIRFGELLLETNYYGTIDYIISVPLHPSKQRKRGYNQSEIIAQSLAQTLGGQCSFDNLRKVKKTHSQTRKLRWERWVNVKDGFNCIDPQVYENKHVLLVDDILTTGATIQACIDSLKTASNIKISVAVMAWAHN